MSPTTQIRIKKGRSIAWAPYLNALILSLGTIAASFNCGCVGEGEVVNPYRCVNAVENPGSAIKIPNEVIKSGIESASIGKSKSPLYVTSAYLWHPADKKIPICWEADSYSDDDEGCRKVVREAVEASWQKALNWSVVPTDKQLRFGGWEKCSPTSEKESFRIQVSHDPKTRETSAVGAGAKGLKNGMTLVCLPAEVAAKQYGVKAPVDGKNSYEFQKSIGLRRAIPSAIHEFGHVLGFRHEQKRPDTPVECLEQPEIKNDPYEGASSPGGGDLMIGAWDEESVMNYCYPKSKNGGLSPSQLSLWDEVGVRAAYYPEYFSFDCIDQIKPKAAGLSVSPQGPAPVTGATVKKLAENPVGSTVPAPMKKSTTAAPAKKK